MQLYWLGLEYMPVVSILRRLKPGGSRAQGHPGLLLFKLTVPAPEPGLLFVPWDSFLPCILTRLVVPFSS